MKSKTIVFIGGTSGIGRAAVQHFLKTENQLIVLYRSQEKLNLTLGDTPKSVFQIPCDLCSMESIKTACEAIKTLTDKVDVLVNNAGMWEFGGRQESKDGIETTFQVNVLSPYYLQDTLRELLLKSDDPRVITTASALHTGTINFQDIEFKKNFSGFKAYRQSKLAVVLLTRLWANENKTIRYFCFHPGVVNTELGRGAGWLAKSFFTWFGSSPEKGAETLIHLVESPMDRLKSGEYYAKKKVAKTYTKASYDMSVAKQLDGVVIDYLKKSVALSGL
jgi:NAD(P)-dependent dehydrogenase (short-subunit alcohol dehydrogenase family)